MIHPQNYTKDFSDIFEDEKFYSDFIISNVTESNSEQAKMSSLYKKEFGEDFSLPGVINRGCCGTGIFSKSDRFLINFTK